MWIEKLHGCFGDEDMVFAGRPADEGRAFELLKFLRKNDIRWTQFKKQFEDYLVTKKCAKPHIDEQLKRAAAFFRAWIAD